MEKPEHEVDARSEELMTEFFEHMETFLAVHPEYEDRRDEVFQAWVIQKIAGIQLSVVELVTSLNAFIQRYDQGQGNR